MLPTSPVIAIWEPEGKGRGVFIEVCIQGFALDHSGRPIAWAIVTRSGTMNIAGPGAFAMIPIDQLTATLTYDGR